MQIVNLVETKLDREAVDEELELREHSIFSVVLTEAVAPYYVQA